MSETEADQYKSHDLTNAYNAVSRSLNEPEAQACQSALASAIGSLEELKRHIDIYRAQEAIRHAEGVIEHQRQVLAALHDVGP